MKYVAIIVLAFLVFTGVNNYIETSRHERLVQTLKDKEAQIVNGDDPPSIDNQSIEEISSALRKGRVTSSELGHFEDTKWVLDLRLFVESKEAQRKVMFLDMLANQIYAEGRKPTKEEVAKAISYGKFIDNYNNRVLDARGISWSVGKGKAYGDIPYAYEYVKAVKDGVPRDISYTSGPD